MPSVLNPEREDSEQELEDQLPALCNDQDCLESGGFMILADNEVGLVYPPPAHILDRFRRSSASRRKPSSPSSRRNSLASSHSHHSNRNYRSTCHSSHVASHLRRASILESRKARLADRAVHAEQVRLRAALAKAAPRITNSEEKVIAAQQARQKHLAKVAAACAEEVNRAKRKAEVMKEKKAAEERRCRLELEEKHAEAEKRRIEYRKTIRRPRTASVPAVDIREPPMRKELSEANAACYIQAVWRSFKRKRIVKEFQTLRLSVETISNSNFIEASTLLADPRVITITRQVMGLFGLESGEPHEETLVRRFLSAFMILSHATDVFNTNGQQEEDLMSKAKELLITFEDVLTEISNSNHHTVRATRKETLSQAYASYLTAFAAWKTQDVSVLIETMVNQFVAFDAIWQTVKNDTRGQVADDYREGIRDNQVILYSKIKRLAGLERANNLIKKAIRENRRATMRQRPREDIRPRPLLTETRSASREGQSQTSFSSATDVRPTNLEVQTNSEGQEISRMFSIIPDNRILVHELTIDPHFRIEVPAQFDVRRHVNGELCRIIRSKIEEGDDASWTAALAENIRARLLKLLNVGSPMHKLLSEVLDPNFVRMQSRQGTFSYINFFTFMADLLPRLCAPVRDGEVKAIAEHLKAPNMGVDEMIENLFGLLHIIDVLSLDYTNYMIHQAAPTLVQESAGYEQRMFAKDLDLHIITLEKTKRWWRHASLDILTEPNSSQHQSAFARTYARGLVELAVGTKPIAALEIPETLELDHARLSRIRKDLLRYTTIGAILSTAKNLLKRDVRSQWKPEAGRIAECLLKGYEDDDQYSTSRILSIIEATHRMPKSSRDQLGHIITRFLAECRGERLTDPVLKLLLQRLKVYLYARIAASTSLERVRVASTTSEGLASIGLSEFMGQISAIAEELIKVSNVDQAAHGSWYRRIVEELDSIGLTEA